MKSYSRVYAEIDLDAVIKNMESMRANLTPDTAMIGVVKTDGYGHGSVPVAKAIDPFVTGYAVATVEEGILLRRHGITKMVLILGSVHESQFEELITYKLFPPVFQLEKAEKLSKLAVSMNERAGIHIALDTGMSRIGFPVNKESAEAVAAISRLPGIRIEGMFTHFAKADETDKSSARRQLCAYEQMMEMLGGMGIDIPMKHCSNSAGIIDLKEADMDAVRAGISIYGMYPSEEVDKRLVPLYPVLSLKSRIVFLKTIEPGTAVSYGGTFVAEKPMRIATIPVGYGDGYPRNLSGKGSVLIRGRRAAILGRICMDQFMVDVTEIPDVCEDDLVTLIGEDRTERISVEEIAETCGGFHYEIVCDIGKRVPRVYKKNGRIVGTKDYFDDVYEGFEEI